MINTGWQLYRAHFAVILGLVLAIELPCQLLLAYLGYHVFPKEDVAYTVYNLQAAFILQAIFGIVVTGGILHALFVDRMERRAGFPECLSTGVTHWFQLFWTNLLFMGLIFLGTLMFVVPGIVVAIRLSLARTVVITEGKWGFEALKRSVELTASRSLKVVNLGLSLLLPLYAAGLGARMLLTNPTLDHWLVAAVLATLIQLAACFITVCFFALYETFANEEAAEV
ncbi:MAG TPA: hypothetical protein VIT91_09480 [Chthoniobacterales bacterium]